jgi:hypothetical protein
MENKEQLCRINALEVFLDYFASLVKSALLNMTLDLVFVSLVIISQLIRTTIVLPKVHLSVNINVLKDSNRLKLTLNAWTLLTYKLKDLEEQKELSELFVYFLLLRYYCGLQSLLVANALNIKPLICMKRFMKVFFLVMLMISMLKIRSSQQAQFKWRIEIFGVTTTECIWLARILLVILGIWLRIFLLMLYKMCQRIGCFNL